MLEHLTTGIAREIQHMAGIPDRIGALLSLAVSRFESRLPAWQVSALSITPSNTLGLSPVDELKGQEVKSRKGEDDDDLEDGEDGHQEVVDAFEFLVARKRRTRVHFKELDQVQQEVDQRYSSKCQGTKPYRQCSVTL